MSFVQKYLYFAAVCCIAFELLVTAGSFADLQKAVPVIPRETTQNQQDFAVQSQTEAVQNQPAKTVTVSDSEDVPRKTDWSQYSDVILPYGCFDENYLNSTVFIGDSNTEGLSVYGYMPAENVLGKRSMTVGQVLDTRFVAIDSGTDVTAIDAAKLLSPQRIVVNLGTNNTDGTSLQEFVSQYRNVITALKTACPDSDIIIAAILPVGYYRENRSIKQSTIDSFNEALAQLCRDDGASFLNYTEVFKGENGYMNTEYVSADGIHLNSKGYSLLLDYVKTHQLVKATNVNNVSASHAGTCNKSDEKIIFDPF